MILASSHQELIWQEWDDLHIIYQPSSSETHVFNKTTALILKFLDEGTLSPKALQDQVEAALSAGEIGLNADDIGFATMRLEELGLIERSDDDGVPE